jgi:hypothetical protein
MGCVPKSKVQAEECVTGTVKTSYCEGGIVFCLLNCGFTIDLFFDPEYGGDIFLLNVG